MPEIIPNLHPLLVHFPIALITVSAVFHVAALTTRNKTCAVLAHTSLWLAALLALPTVLFGWLAFNSVNHDDAGHVAMLTHRAWALGTLALLALLAIWDALRCKVDAKPAWWFAGAVIGAWGIVAVTAWHGGELVYRHGLGVMSLPASEAGQSHGHAHNSIVDGADHADVIMPPEDNAHEHPQGQPHEHLHDGHAH